MIVFQESVFQVMVMMTAGMAHSGRDSHGIGSMPNGPSRALIGPSRLYM